jgi:YVTN family beta-propeller protein
MVSLESPSREGEGATQLAKARLLPAAWLLSLAVLLGCGADSQPPATQSTPPTLFALMTASFDAFGAPPQSAVEVVNLASGSALRTVSLGARVVTSLAVSPDKSRLYVTDRTSNAVVVADALTGAVLAAVPVTVPSDTALSADGSRLYVSAQQSVVAIDTATHTVQATLATGSDTPLGLSLSPNGSTLAAVSTAGGASPALYLIDAATLTLTARVPITNPGEPTNCATFPNDVAFAGAGRVLLWDSNCDNIYQVDVPSATQLTAGTIRLGRDGGSSANFNNVLHYGSPSARAYVVKESTAAPSLPLAVVDPAAANGALIGGFSGTPFVPALTPDGGTLVVSVIHRFSGGGADTLDRFDTASSTFTPGVYTFSSSTMSVRDMRILP